MEPTTSKGQYKEVTGNLIELALKGQFEVITHGCNCFCKMGAGIAPAMAKAFGCDKFPMEQSIHKGNINKLGTIDCKDLLVSPMSVIPADYEGICTQEMRWPLTVINSYTQYRYGRNHEDGDVSPLDYDALALCLKKINHLYPGKKIGLPKIGCGLAGGDWRRVRPMIQYYLKDMDVTIVNLPQ